MEGDIYFDIDQIKSIALEKARGKENKEFLFTFFEYAKKQSMANSFHKEFDLYEFEKTIQKITEDLLNILPRRKTAWIFVHEPVDCVVWVYEGNMLNSQMVTILKKDWKKVIDTGDRTCYLYEWGVSLSCVGILRSILRPFTKIEIDDDGDEFVQDVDIFLRSEHALENIKRTYYQISEQLSKLDRKKWSSLILPNPHIGLNFFEMINIYYFKIKFVQ